MMGIVLLGACSDDTEEGRSNERVALQIESCIEAEVHASTRAYNDIWENKDSIGVFLTNTNTSNIYTDETGTRGSNLKYIIDKIELYTSDSISETSNGTVFRNFKGTDVYLPTTYIDAYAYYPYKTQDGNHDGIDDWLPTAIPINVSDQTNQNAIDFMCTDLTNDEANWKRLSKNSSTARLRLKHMLVKLKFNLKVGSDLLPTEITITEYNEGRLKVGVGNMPTTATCNVFSATSANYSNNATIYAVPVAAKDITAGYQMTFECLVLPTTTPHTVTVTIGTTSNTFTICDGIDTDVTAFEAGHLYTYNVTLNATSIRVETDMNRFTEQW